MSLERTSATCETPEETPQETPQEVPQEAGGREIFSGFKCRFGKILNRLETFHCFN